MGLQDTTNSYELHPKHNTYILNNDVNVQKLKKSNFQTFIVWDKIHKSLTKNCTVC